MTIGIDRTHYDAAAARAAVEGIRWDLDNPWCVAQLAQIQQTLPSFAACSAADLVEFLESLEPLRFAWNMEDIPVVAFVAHLDALTQALSRAAETVRRNQGNA